MQTKPLLYGLVGFFIGGFIVSLAVTTFEKPKENHPINSNTSEKTMSQLVSSLKDKTGDDYDKVFIADMIAHHQSAVDMAKLSAGNAKHDEIKQLSQNIITAQEKEITEMKQWQKEWGYEMSSSKDGMNHSSPQMSH